MKNISVSLTGPQILAQTKTVTRRLKWLKLKAGDVLQPVNKCMGLKAGEKPQKIGPPIKVISVRREPLADICNEPDGPAKEGFPEMSGPEFVAFFAGAMKCYSSQIVTRIEFEYLKPAPRSEAVFDFEGQTYEFVSDPEAIPGPGEMTPGASRPIVYSPEDHGQ